MSECFLFDIRTIDDQDCTAVTIPKHKQSAQNLKWEIEHKVTKNKNRTPLTAEQIEHKKRQLAAYHAQRKGNFRNMLKQTEKVVVEQVQQSETNVKDHVTATFNAQPEQLRQAVHDVLTGQWQPPNPEATSAQGRVALRRTQVRHLNNLTNLDRDKATLDSAVTKMKELDPSKAEAWQDKVESLYQQKLQELGEAEASAEQKPPKKQKTSSAATASTSSASSNVDPAAPAAKKARTKPAAAAATPATPATAAAPLTPTPPAATATTAAPLTPTPLEATATPAAEETETPPPAVQGGSSGSKPSLLDLEEEAAKKQFLCTHPGCGYPCPSLLALQRHQHKAKHQPKFEPAPDNFKVCPFPGCKQTFPTTRGLKTHQTRQQHHVVETSGETAPAPTTPNPPTETAAPAEAAELAKALAAEEKAKERFWAVNEEHYNAERWTPILQAAEKLKEATAHVKKVRAEFPLSPEAEAAAAAQAATEAASQKEATKKLREASKAENLALFAYEKAEQQQKETAKQQLDQAKEVFAKAREEYLSFPASRDWEIQHRIVVVKSKSDRVTWLKVRSAVEAKDKKEQKQKEAKEKQENVCACSLSNF